LLLGKGDTGINGSASINGTTRQRYWNRNGIDGSWYYWTKVLTGSTVLLGKRSTDHRIDRAAVGTTGAKEILE
jgi:hypothetical protein